jgi:nitrite reductase/ring-hydroxylating ferredoxin subunit
MAGFKRLICDSDSLIDGGEGVRFDFDTLNGRKSAFAVRYRGEVYAYFNRCTHLPYELDWVPGNFFDSGRAVLICSVHGASYDPRTGLCVGGPCKRGLERIAVHESDGKVYLAEKHLSEDDNDVG